MVTDFNDYCAHLPLLARPPPHVYLAKVFRATEACFDDDETVKKEREREMK